MDVKDFIPFQSLFFRFSIAQLVPSFPFDFQSDLFGFDIMTELRILAFFMVNQTADNSRYMSDSLTVIRNVQHATVRKAGPVGFEPTTPGSEGLHATFFESASRCPDEC